MNLQEFKNKLLLEAVHQEERYCSLQKHFENAEFQIRNKYPYHESDPAYTVYMIMCSRLNYLKNLIKVCSYLYAQGFKPGYITTIEEYILIFQARIKRAKKLMFKLRPFVLSYVKDWDYNRRLKDQNHAEYGQFFGKWYVAPIGLS